MKTKKKILVVTPYYPSPIDNTNGIFIKQQIDLIKSSFSEVVIFKYKSVSTKSFIKDILTNQFSYENNSIKIYNLFYFDNSFVNRIFINKLISTKFQIMLNYYFRFLFFKKFDVILSQWILPTTYLFSFLPKRKIVSVARGMDMSILREEFPKQFLFALHKSDIVIGNGRYVSEIIKELDKNTIVETVYNPKKLDIFLKLKINAKERLSNIYNFTCVGSFDKKFKRQDLLIDLVYELKKKGFSINLTLIGKGKDFIEYKKLSMKLGVESNVNFLSNLSHSQIAKVLSSTDLYIQPSSREGVPNALAEAMASGCCCISRDVGGVSDLIDDQINGFLFNTDSELFVLVEKVLKFDDLKVRHSARKKIIEIFDNNLNISKLLEHLS